MQHNQFIGVDVAQDWVDIADAANPQQARRIDNTPAALEAWAASLAPTRVGLVAFEPTGGLERGLRQALLKAAIPFARVHPNEVVAFRALRGVKAKTDRIDAALLARFARHARPGVRQVLFQAARCAIRWKPVIRAFFLHLTEVNKRPGKVALTAVMRKILVILNAIAHDAKPWANLGLDHA